MGRTRFNGDLGGSHGGGPREWSPGTGKSATLGASREETNPMLVVSRSSRSQRDSSPEFGKPGMLANDSPACGGAREIRAR